MTTIVDYGAGNLRSVIRALERLGESAVVSSRPEVVERASRLILPGVGSFDAAVNGLRSNGLIEVLEDRVQRGGIPILGICLGLQLFTQRSDEGTLPGLGWIRGETKLFESNGATLRVPHIGWNEVRLGRPSELFANLPTNPALYFVHSYYVTCDDEEKVLARSTYGHPFVSAVQFENITGVQFHPEKSQHLGLQLLANFLRTS